MDNFRESSIGELSLIHVFRFDSGVHLTTYNLFEVLLGKAFRFGTVADVFLV
jgi:hypothetical protein